MPNLINLKNSDLDSEYNLEGYDAHDAQGNKIGDIEGVIVDEESMQPRYVVVEAGGWFNTRQFVVPAGDIREIDDDQRHVHFAGLTKQTLQSGQYPRYDDSWWDTNDHASFSQHEREVARAYQPEGGARTETETDRVDYSDRLYQRPQEGAQRLQLLEERLRATKEQEQAGVVRLGKRIVERTESVSVPLREERVIIERTPGSGQPITGDAEFRDGETIEVPLMKERVNVSKEAVVSEEVNVRTEAIEREEQVQATVRREELVVDEQGDVAVEGADAGPGSAHTETSAGGSHSHPGSETQHGHTGGSQTGGTQTGGSHSGGAQTGGSQTGGTQRGGAGGTDVDDSGQLTQRKQR